MGSIVHTFQLLSLFILIFSVCVFAFKIPRLGISQRHDPQTKSSSSQFHEDLKTYYYTQRLDHFNYRPESSTTFQQRYFINFKYWGGAKSKAPIFAYLGCEEAVDIDIPTIGFITDNAPQFNALIVYIEHRYYGKSVPFGSPEEAMRNASTLGYFNSAQALADYADVLLHIKKKLSAHYSPIIVIGCSYGGMLASWFRLKYPHIALGALASSAPILYFSGIAPRYGYYYIVSKDFREASKSCYQTIRKSWSEMDRVAMMPNGLSILNKRFKPCKKIETSSDLKSYLNLVYANAAQFNHPPEYPVNIICRAIDSAASKTDIVGQIIEGVVAFNGPKKCYDMNEYNDPPGWDWQSCSEMIEPIGQENWNGSMFEVDPFNMTNYVNHCKRLYGMLPQPHWITTYYGGQDIKLVLQRFASNIIFSNGLKDPYSSGGVLDSISDSVIALSTVNGSHCLDVTAKEPSDPDWLVEQRNTEVEIIKGWIKQYQADLLKLKIK